MTRREFIKAGTVLSASLPILGRAAEAQPVLGHIQTVLGRVRASELGRTLAHEHVMCDFIGADKTGRDRWKVSDVVARIKPLLMEIKSRGITGFIDCTPACIGRDPRVLKKLAQETGLHIVTNTGYYGGANDKYVPAHAYTESEDEIFVRWLNEWNDGIEGTGVRPGFVKIGVDEVSKGSVTLSDIDAKLVRVSAKFSRETMAPVTCHTGGGAAGLAAAKLFIKEGGVPGRFIVAHSDGHGLSINEEVARLGCWVSFDGISRKPLAEHLKLVQHMVENYASRLLLSHDNGWYNVGQANGGDVRNYNYLSDTFLPTFERAGATHDMIDTLTIANPSRAFSVRPIG